jgi:nucleotide-binding universal stress UspA family protein
MRNNKYKILVLSDLKKSTHEIVKSTISLAKMIDADISFFHVKKPIDVVESESQLSAYRVINEQHTVTKNSIENVIESVSKIYGVELDYSYKFGNVKNEIGDYIIKYNPDIIVLGKRNSNLINFIGDSITDFVLKTYKGIIMIVGDENGLEPNQSFSLGLLNGQSFSNDSEFKMAIFSKAQKPLKAFSIVEKLNKIDNKDRTSGTKTIEYVFEYNDNALQSLSSYLSKNNINLLLIDRNNKNHEQQRHLKQLDIKSVINKLNVSLLISSL